jgi:hypothetical protein
MPPFCSDGAAKVLHGSNVLPVDMMATHEPVH